jgi:hypothetical protein
MAGKTIPISLAHDMIGKYYDHVRNLPVEPNKKTQYISFTLPEIMDYLKQVTPFADELRICLGVHPQDSDKPGRVTVIIWPYKSDKPATKPITEGKDGGGGDEGIDPYNDGNNAP